jgi:hypothetical protein
MVYLRHKPPAWISANLQDSNMQGKVLNHATVGVVGKMDIRGRATADEIKRGLRKEKKRCFWGLASRVIPGCLMAVGLLVALLAPLSASADGGGIPGEIAALQAQVAALQKQVATLQTQLAVVQGNKALGLGPFVSVISGLVDGVNGPHIYFTGANIHIVSGSGATNDNGNPLGLGNLIIGYDENPGTYVDNSPFDNLPLAPLATGDRGGSHNLVIGAANRFTQAAFGGLVIGTANTITSYGASVTGGAGNTAPDYGSSVSGGFLNTAGGFYSSISGGSSNNTGGPAYNSVSGGNGNIAGVHEGGTSGWWTSVSGGSGNIAVGNYSSITGGSGNTTYDENTTITGGTNNIAGSFVTFEGGIGSIVVGGSNNNAGGRNSVVIGGQSITDNTDNSIQPKAPYP